MRTKSVFFAAAALTAGLLTASAQSNVYSLNIVGYVNRPVVTGGAGQYSLVANPLNSSGDNTFSNVLAALPAGSQVLKWDTAGSFITINRTSFGTTWSPTTAGTNTLGPGEGCFVKLPTGVSLTNTFVGEVLSSATNNYVAGFTLSANPLPIAGDATTLGLTAALPSGSQLLIWNEATQSYNTFNRTTFGSGWSPSIPNLGVGQGYFVKVSNPTNWVQSLPPQP
jgi:hypothetical protein